jgi:uncharacterized protein YcaQ
MPGSSTRPRSISAATARRLAIRTQGLDGSWELLSGKRGAVRTIDRLGYVQIDTMAVVERAHHHTLWCRQPDYEPDMLHELQRRDRRVFEYWCHGASYLPIDDYPYYLPRMRAYADSASVRDWLEANRDLVRNVLSRVRSEGPLTSADFSAPEGRKRGSWWDWKPAKQALEMLFSVGELMVSERRNFQRVYDLTERVLPASLRTGTPSSEELAHFAVRRAVSSRGVVSVDQLRWGRLADSAALRGALESFLRSGEVALVRVVGLDAQPQYAWTEALEAALKTRRRLREVRILSPFDSLVIDRRRLRALFDFDCKLECYFPAAKRRYGYFCLPVLWGDRFVGRMDPKADRKRKVLLLRNVLFEPGFGRCEELLLRLAAALRSFAAFNGCEQIVVQKARPAAARSTLQKLLG